MLIHRRRRVVAVLVLSLLGLGGVAGPPAHAAPPMTGLFVDSEPGDTVGAGTTYDYTPSNSSMTSALPGAKANTIQLTVTSPSPCTSSCTTWNVKMQTNEDLFTVGKTYTDVVAFSASNTTAPGLSVDKGTACSTVTGQFTVDEFDSVGPVITKFVARFEQHCNGLEPTLFGDVSWQGQNASYYKRKVSANSLDFGDVKLGSSLTKTLTIDANGGSELTVGAPTFTPADGPFSLADNGCLSSVTATCDLKVKFEPTEEGDFDAVMTFTDQLSQTGRDIALSGTGTSSELTVVGSPVLFGLQRVGVLSGPETVTLSSTGTEAVNISDITFEGLNESSFLGDTDCPDSLESGESCDIDIYAYPTASGLRATSLHIEHDATTGPADIPVTVSGTLGYFLAEADGTVTAEGDADDSLGDMSGEDLNAPILGMSATHSGDGYWLVGGDGGIFSFGDADFHGSMGSTHLNQPIFSMSSTADDAGYWLVASDGGIFAFGDAAFHGSMGGTPLNQPVVGLATTPTGGGYWMVASDGGIFAFGDAGFYGSLGSLTLNQPIVAMAVTPTGHGYWLVAADGGIFAFGDAGFYGSKGGEDLNAPIISMAPSPTGFGYWLLGLDGTVYQFGDAPWLGDLGDTGVGDVIAIAPTSPLVDPERSDGRNPMGLPRSG